MSENVQQNQDAASGTAAAAQANLTDQKPDQTTDQSKQTDQTKADQQIKADDKASDKSLLNQDDKKPDAALGAPEKYEPFTAPEGFEIDETVIGEASGLFKELGLPQAAAQKLVDFYAKQSLDAAEAPIKFYKDMQDKWITEIKADPEIGGKLDNVRATVGRAIDGLGDPKLAADFRAAMDLTGAGNNPAFIRAFYKLAQKVTEGAHVGGQPRGPEKPRSAAQAIYPNLPSGG